MAESKIASLQSLRGIAATAIFVHHAGYDSVYNVAAGTFAVMYFFALSGFLMSKTYSEQVNSPDFRFWPYITKKMRKLYPFNILCAVLCLPFMIGMPLKAMLIGFGANVTMTQGWLLNHNIAISCNGPAWTQSCVLFFYTVFPLLAIAVKRNFKAVSITYFAAVLAYLLLVPYIPERLEQDYVYFFPPMRLLDFVLGIMVWNIFDKYSSRICIKPDVKEFAAVVVAAAGIIYFASIPLCYQEVAWWWLPSVLLLTAFAGGGGGVISRALEWKPLVKLGNLSFCFYLLHSPMIMGVNAAFDALHLELPKAISIAIIYAATVALSVPLTRIFVGRKPAKSLGA